jgi:SAM-dependent methyltransferase
MNGFRLPEYDPAAARQQLHALLRLPAGLVPEFGELLRSGCPDLVLNFRSDQNTMLAVFPAGGDCRDYLTLLGTALDALAGASGAGPELLETRLAAPAGEGRPEAEFSRHIRLLDREAKVAAGEFGLRLEHGTSFGSGRHPSTRLAMRGLDRLFAEVKPFPGRLLDVGCGSGVLALAGALFGAREVLGIDIDGAALTLAAGNAAANRLAERVRFSAQLLAEVAGPYDLVVANVTGAVMGGMLADFSRLVCPGGWLMVSGLQGRQLAEMAEVLHRSGFAEVERFAEGSWRAGLFRFRLFAAQLLRP